MVANVSDVVWNLLYDRAEVFGAFRERLRSFFSLRVSRYIVSYSSTSYLLGLGLQHAIPLTSHGQLSALTAHIDLPYLLCLLSYTRRVLSPCSQGRCPQIADRALACLASPPANGPVTPHDVHNVVESFGIVCAISFCDVSPVLPGVLRNSMVGGIVVRTFCL